MKILTFFLLLLTTIVFNSCYKLATEVDPLYLDFWIEVDGPGYFAIENNAKSVYKDSNSNLIYGVVEKRLNKLRIKNLTFKINQKPRLDSVCTCTWSSTTMNYYSMVLDDVTYIALK
jgi:hypothetical protein